MVVWVTGSAGFIGSALVSSLASAGVKVLVSSFDIQDQEQISTFVRENAFDAVVHLAGISSVPDCEKDKKAASAVNSQAVYFLGEAIATYRAKAHLIFPSTSHVYQVPALGTQDEVYEETSPVLPRNYYGLTKLQAEENIHYLAKNKGLRATILRLFNHTHMSQPPNFFLPSVYSQMKAAIQKGESKVLLRLGDVNVERDIGVIQDLISAFQAVLHAGHDGEPRAEIYNVSSGKKVALKSLITELAQQMKIEPHIEVDSNLVRANEPKSVLGKNQNFCNRFHWQPRHAVSSKTLISAFLTNLNEMGIENHE